MKALVIGANGFAGRYMCRDLSEHGYSVIGADRCVSENIRYIDILDPESIGNIISETKPDIIFNLAGFASVAESWKKPAASVSLNVIGTINLLEAVRAVSNEIKVVLIGSSNQYGSAEGESRLVNEKAVLDPVSPYAISKRCQEDFGITYANFYGMDICMTRSFNHIGVGQSLGFVVTDFAYGISEIEKGNRQSLKVGNLNSERCFTDVRDAVAAYRLIGEKGKKGTVYNVGTEKAYSMEKLLNILIGFSEHRIVVETDQSKLRKFDPSCIRCDSSLLRKDTGWEPVYSIEQTLKEILDYYRNNDIRVNM